jgi:hypothetical protein
VPGAPRLIVFPGSAVGLGDAAGDVVLAATDPDVRRAVADVTGDGTDDLVVAWDPGGPGARLAVYLGGPGGLSLAAPTQVFTTPSTLPTFGAQLEAAGDLDGDGDDEILVSTTDGASYAYWTYPGTPTGLGAPAAFGVPHPCPLAAHAVPDTDGDGRGELLLSSSCYAGGREATGVFAHGVVPPAVADRVWSGAGPDDPTGSGLAAGDFDADGRWDWVMWDPTPALGVVYGGP